MKNLKEAVKGAVIGAVTADALGVPVEFKSRSSLLADPVKDMREYGTHNQPKGTWSDDSSLMLATMDSLIQGYDPDDIIQKFCSWFTKGEYTPYGKVFDMGITTRKALADYRVRKNYKTCGRNSINENGNGSLMRILPISVYALCSNKSVSLAENAKIDLIHTVSALTHAHEISLIGCVIYSYIIKNIIENPQLNKIEVISQGIRDAFNYYGRTKYRRTCYDVYKRLDNIPAFLRIPVDEIKSSGYVADTLEAAIWCFITANSYEECVLKAVNLGNDTDTVGSVAGGIAGCFYGYENIPSDWVSVLAKKEWIHNITEKFSDSLGKNI